MMRVIDKESLDSVPPQKIEINPSHDLIVALRALGETNPTLAKVSSLSLAVLCPTVLYVCLYGCVCV
jgi:hypothetical protein